MALSTIVSRPSAESPLLAMLRDVPMSAHRIQVPAKAAVYQPGDLAKNLYVIQIGQIRTYQVSPTGSRRLVEILGPGEWCGAAALARHATYGEVAEAVMPTTVMIVPVDRLFEALPQDPQAAVALIQELAGKLGAYREDAGGLVFEDCNHRLMRTLVELSDSPAASASGESVVLHITHQQLAQKVGVARETVSLALAQFRRQNLLRTGRNQLTFSPDALKKWKAGAPAAPVPKTAPEHHG